MNRMIIPIFHGKSDINLIKSKATLFDSRTFLTLYSDSFFGSDWLITLLLMGKGDESHVPYGHRNPM